ncbi:hypothetical protein PVAG01_03514 [Phlyctema vagabunda]|uniref:Uncharacterized protein n=1 Tax=Phlyctema vagabunda TaxID=108571 RepID=A0ABR4PLM2_9HELO
MIDPFISSELWRSSEAEGYSSKGQQSEVFPSPKHISPSAFSEPQSVIRKTNCQDNKAIGQTATTSSANATMSTPTIDADGGEIVVARDVRAEDIKTEKADDEEQQAPVSEQNGDGPRQTYKSFKKKYRKMRVHFDEKMRLSNDYYTEEQKATDTARRLAQENDRLLDLLLDVNNSAQIPPHHRFDLSLDTPALSAVPGLVPEDEVLSRIERSTAAGEALHKEIQKMLEEKAVEKETAKLPANYSSKSLVNMMQVIPHHTLSSPLAPPDLLASLDVPEEGHNAPLSYLSLDRMDEYIQEIDSVLFKTPAPSSLEQKSAYLDLAMKNPHSVYNWLRRHEPKIFLQDGEGSEKLLGKPGSLRGAGKRASIPAPSKPDSLEFVEEDGIGYDATLSGTQGGKGAYGKRKRDDDDGGYVPKKRNSMDDPKPKKVRQSRKKKGDGSAADSTPTERSRKGKAKEKEKEKMPASSPAPGHELASVTE